MQLSDPWNRVAAIGTVICAASAIFEIADRIKNSREAAMSGLFAPLLVLVACAFASYFWWRLRKALARPTAFLALYGIAENGLHAARELNAEGAAQHRLPLKPSSFPEPGKEWSYHQLRMKSLAESIDMIKALTPAFYIGSGKGCPQHVLLMSNELTPLFELIPALEEFRDSMERTDRRLRGKV